EGCSLGLAHVSDHDTRAELDERARFLRALAAGAAGDHDDATREVVARPHAVPLAVLTRIGRIRSDADIVARVYERDHFLIGGRRSTPRGDGALEVVSPSSEEVIGRVPLASAADVDDAVGAARAAFDSGPWPRLPLAERARILLAAHDALLPQA